MTTVIIENSQSKVAHSKGIDALIDESVCEALASEGFDFIDEVDVLLVDNEAIRILNRDYRNMDKATDVLSFPLYESAEEIFRQKEIGAPLLLGDIVISLEQAQIQGMEFGHGTEREIAYLTVHSVLHLLGYDHMDEDEKSRMREKEEEVMKRLKLERTER